MADDKQKIEIELELKNKSSEAIQAIAKSVSDAVKRVSEIGSTSGEASSGVVRAVEGVKNLGEKAKVTTGVLGQLSAFLAPLAGPAGTIALIGTALVAAGNALNEFAGKRLRFQNLSTDLGFTTSQMSIMLQAFKGLGMSAENAQGHLEEIGSALKNLSTYGARSEIFRELSLMNRAKFAAELLETVNAGKFYEAFEKFNTEYMRIYTEEGPKAAANFAATLPGFTKTIGMRYAEQAKGLTAAYQINTEILRDFHSKMEKLSNELDDAWAKKKYELMKESLEFGKWFGNFFDKMPMGTPPEGFRSPPWLEPGGPKPWFNQPPSSFSERFGDWGEKFGDRFPKEKEKEIKKDSNSTLEKIRDSIKNLFGIGPKQHGGPVEQGKRYLVGELEPELYVGGGMIQVVGGKGPEVFQPKSAGIIVPKADDDDWIDRIRPKVEYPYMGVPRRMQKDTESGNRLRSRLRGLFGIPDDDPSEPAPWLPGGAWKRTDRQLEDQLPPLGEPAPWMDDDRRQIDILLNSETGGGGVPNLNAEVSFRNIPPGVVTKADGDGFDNFKVNKSRALQ